MSTIHNAGLPWYLTIPLLAAGVNFTVRLPLQYYGRRIAVKRSELSPMLQAWSARHAQEARANPDVRKASLQRIRAFNRSRRRIFKAWGVQVWKSFVPFASMVPFVVASESLRRLTGMSVSLPGSSSGADPVSTALSATPEAAPAVFDPSLTDGGCLWFVDLAAADPYMALPLLCSAILAVNAWGSLTRQRIQSLLVTDGSKGQDGTSPMTRALQRILLAVPLMPLLMSHLPAAIMLYWASSFSMSLLNDRVLKRLLPTSTPKLKPPPTDKPVVLPFLPSKRMTDHAAP